jgi:hypothetical protein
MDMNDLSRICDPGKFTALVADGRRGGGKMKTAVWFIGMTGDAHRAPGCVGGH